MSMEAKQIILKNLEKHFGKTLTVEEVNSVLKTIADELESYSLELLNTDSVDNTSNDMLDTFLVAKGIEGRSPKTLARYKYVITKMLTTIKVPIRSITKYHLRRYLLDMQERGCADSTIKGVREVFSSFFNWLQRESLIDNNPIANIEPIKCKKVERLPFTNVEIEKLKENCKTTRDKAIIMFLLSTGCRIGEVTSLNKKDLDLANLQCKVLGKGNKERIVFIDDITALALERYLKERTDNNEALFIGKGNNRLLPGGVRSMLVQLGKRAGVENVHPHRFRRTRATNFIHRGMPIQEVAKILGHEKIDTTMKYVYIDHDDLHFSYDKFSR